jgi:hypothetical protein
VCRYKFILGQAEKKKEKGECEEECDDHGSGHPPPLLTRLLFSLASSSHPPPLLTRLFLGGPKGLQAFRPLPRHLLLATSSFF